MTKQELSQLYYLKREIAQNRERLAQLEAMATGTTAKLTGMPHGESAGRINQYGPEIADLRTLIEQETKKCIDAMDWIVRFISEIPDSQTRMIFKLRYVDGLKWGQVANRIGGGNLEDGVRKKHDRYLQRKTKLSVLSDSDML